jgi:trehalose-phosphatase
MIARTSEALAAVPAALWPAVAAAPHRLLMLDYDGTLAPFHDRRGEAQVARGMWDRIERIARLCGTTVAVISGRSLPDLVGLAGGLPVTLVGEHGWALRRPGGRSEEHPVPPECAARLRRAAEAADAAGWGARIERKRASIVLHARGLPPDQADALLRAGRAAWRAHAARDDLRLQDIDGGLELRARARDKGMAARDLIASSPVGVLAVFLGDDATDEDAFREVQGAGFGIRVGPAQRATLAGGRLPSVEAVALFLERWVEIVLGRGRP